ncbi:ParB/RepB/Spo0J family partition protein [Pseudoroseicyclus aestuarii]|uniref:ParB family chromosome partitioning protein n=1 Tax=Pseudoroseicyclus aestuarii TaxID=1795041 RepID=A0A318SN29_9RHOB|nr:ParB/RepB/Spo0J family partition protein [Pseudoroseicyclus aestuarii]PYE82244.1 ParB family chromosome partitioning protein [Pseudoroseicyclus aestuarii]
MSSRKHDAVFDDVLSGLDQPAAPAEAEQARGGTRFLKRSHALGERMAGTREEKLLHWVDPAECRMWERHNRDYAALTEESCRDLIDGMLAQGRQEFPAVVRRLKGEDHAYEVICGARRHFAVSWLRANTYTQFRYLVEVRDLTDEEAFRLSDLENRERADLSDFERARDYAEAIELYYGGKQKTMAQRLEVSEAWLSRFLALARLPAEVRAAFASPHDLRELHARTLKPLLADPARRAAILEEAAALAQEQREGAGLEAAAVMRRLKSAGVTPSVPALRHYGAEGRGVSVRRKGRGYVIEMPGGLSRPEAEAALAAFVAAQFDPESGSDKA